MLSCRQFVEVVTNYLENSLDDELRRDALKHLSTCPQCRIYLSQIQTVIRLLRKLPASYPEQSRVKEKG
jgi:anti-sigma factor RsiW